MSKTRLKRLYAPYIKDGKRWKRATYSIPHHIIHSDKNISVIEVKDKEYSAYFKDKAIRVYQDWLLAPFLQGIDEKRELRPIPLHSSEYGIHSLEEYEIKKGE